MIMRSCSEGFDDINFSECTIQSFKDNKGTIEIVFKEGLEILPQHPLAAGVSMVLGKAVLRFSNVTSSRREVFEYYHDSGEEKIRQPYLVEESVPSSSDEIHEYYIEGVIEAPKAWVGWEIHAAQFELLVEEMTAKRGARPPLDAGSKP